VEKSIVSEEKKKPVLDEHTLGKLLEAAYVLQEHNRELREIELGLDLKRDKIEAEAKIAEARIAEARIQEKIQAKAQPAPAAEPAQPREPAPAAPADYTFTLAQIVAAQHQIQIRSLELDKAMALVTERVTEIARAGGAAIGMLEGKKVRYRAVSGSMTPKLGSEVATEKALCLPCIRNAQVFRCADVNPEFLVDSEECRRRGIQSLIAVPIFHEGVAAGGLELYYAGPQGFTDQDIHTCQLETIARQ
jgi:GAF domain-containing protein